MSAGRMPEIVFGIYACSEWAYVCACAMRVCQLHAYVITAGYFCTQNNDITAATTRFIIDSRGMPLRDRINARFRLSF